MNAVLEARDPIALQSKPVLSTPVQSSASTQASTSPTWLEKLTVSGAAFGFATTMFIFSALVMIPNASRFMHSLYVSEPIQQVVVLFLMFGLPLLAAMYGIRLGRKTTFSNSLYDDCEK